MTHYTTKRDIYVGPFSFPDGGAAVRRILGNGQTMKAAGFSVSIACGQSPGAAGSSFEHEGIEVISLGERMAAHLPRVSRTAFRLPCLFMITG